MSEKKNYLVSILKEGDTLEEDYRNSGNSGFEILNLFGSTYVVRTSKEIKSFQEKYLSNVPCAITEINDQLIKSNLTRDVWKDLYEFDYDNFFP
jgi:maltooligosyltrehalose synthase